MQQLLLDAVNEDASDCHFGVYKRPLCEWDRCGLYRYLINMILSDAIHMWCIVLLQALGRISADPGMSIHAILTYSRRVNQTFNCSL